MAKRTAEDEVQTGDQAYAKRQRLGGKVVPSSREPEEIRSGRQLRSILTFDQNTPVILYSVQTFKRFLDSFKTPEIDNCNAPQISILKEYFGAQRELDEEDKTAAFLPDLMQMWSLAAEKNDDALFSGVAAVLALLMKTISGIPDLLEPAMKLGRTLLLKPQLELIARGLSSSKSKQPLISPVLRLLRELACLDGGVFAKQIFAARDSTFKNMVGNFDIYHSGDSVEDRRRPSVRTLALRFVLAIIRFLSAEGKGELLSQRFVISALIKGMHFDPPYVVRETLATLKTHVLLDEALPRDAKSKLATTSNLTRISLLYRYDIQDEELAAGKKPINELAHEFLTLVCTSPTLGALTQQSGYYPKGVDPNSHHDFNTDESFIDLDIDSIEWMGKFIDQVPVRNGTLSGLIQNLRPWSNLQESQLVLSIFRAAPELVADFFYHQKDFSFDPKLTATWIGYSAFLFSTVHLPLAPYFGRHERYARLPPPHALVLESILPQPLDRKVLTRCLVQPHDNIISFFAIRILCLAFRKLQDALAMYREAAKGAPSIWASAAEKLVNLFCQRCPSIKDVIVVYRRLSENDLMQREATTRLLVLYFELVPRIALEAKFDVSTALAENLGYLEDTTQTDKDRVLRVMELENLFAFAHFSPGMRWFSKTDGNSTPPFMAMLKLATEAPADLTNFKLKSVLGSVTKENQILQAETSISALDALIMRLGELSKEQTPTYAFVADCIFRCATKPMKYILDLEEISGEIYGSDKKVSSVSLLSLVVTEQWPFMVKSSDDETLRPIAGFIANYLASSIRIGEDEKVVQHLLKKIIAQTPESSTAWKEFEKPEKLVESVDVPETNFLTSDLQEIRLTNRSAVAKAEIISKMENASNGFPEDRGALTRWTSKEADEVIENGHLTALIALLSSEHLSVRKEAVTNLSKFSFKLKNSTFQEKDQIWLLLCELVETAKKVVDTEPLTNIITAFASAAITVLKNPLHGVYPKINAFLTKGPEWDYKKVPLMFKVLDEAPSLDDGHYSEIAWLLTYMLAGLRTPSDMNIFRKRQVFEKLFSLYNSPYLRTDLRDKILKIIFQATTIEGGSTTLITRASAMTWLQAQVALGGGLPLQVLMERILETCDEKRVRAWAKGAKLEDVKGEMLRFR